MKNLISILCFIFISNIASFSQDSNVDTIAWSINMDHVVVTAQYAPTDSKNAIHKIRTIQLKEINQKGVTNLEQLLQQELNIRISQDQILGSSLNLQGVSGQNVQILIDGVPVIGRVGDDIDLGQISLQNIERVEIIEGPLSVNYGTNALGGVINLITKKSQVKRFNIQTESQVESINRYNINTTLGFRPAKKWLTRLHGGYNEFGGFNTNNNLEDATLRTYQWNPKVQKNLGGMLRYDLANDHQIRYSYNWFNESIKNLGIIKRPQFKPYAFDDYYHTKRVDQTLHQEGSLGKKYYLITTIGYNLFKRTKNTYRYNFDSGEQSEVPNEQDTTHFDSFVFRPVFASKYQDRKINFQVGFDLRHESGLGKRIKDDKAKKENYSELGDYAIFGSLQYSPINQISIQLGARSAYNTKFKAPITPSINLKYSPSKKVTLRASYAKGFRSPSLKEMFFYFVDANHYILGNKNLKAEVSNNYQLSLDLATTIKKHKLGISLSGFYNDIQQKIDLYSYVIIDSLLVPAVSVGQISNKYAYFNLSNYKSVGGDIRLNYGYQNFNTKIGFSPIGRYNILSETDEDVDRFTYVFETNGEINYRFPKKELQLSIYLRYNDKLIRYFEGLDEEDNLVTKQFSQDGYMLADFTVSKFFWKKQIQLITGVKNIFDIKEVATSKNQGGVHSAGGNIPVGLGRNWFVGLKLNLGWN